MVHTFIPSTQEEEAGGSLKFEAILVYTASSRTARITQKNPILKIKKKKSLLYTQGILRIIILRWREISQVGLFSSHMKKRKNP